MRAADCGGRRDIADRDLEFEDGSRVFQVRVLVAGGPDPVGGDRGPVNWVRDQDLVGGRSRVRLDRAQVLDRARVLEPALVRDLVLAPVLVPVLVLVLVLVPVLAPVLVPAPATVLARVPALVPELVLVPALARVLVQAPTVARRELAIFRQTPYPVRAPQWVPSSVVAA